MATKVNIEKNHVYIITLLLDEYIRELGLHRKFEDYSFKNQKLEICAICRDYEGSILIEFFYGLEGHGNLEFATGILCSGQKEARAEIFRYLPHLLNYEDLKNLIKALKKEER